MAEKKLFHVRKGYVWLTKDGEGVQRPQPDMREVKLDPDGPEFEAQKHKLEEFAPETKDSKAEAARQGTSPKNRMVEGAPGNRS